jgi:hypothetical protein
MAKLKRWRMYRSALNGVFLDKQARARWEAVCRVEESSVATSGASSPVFLDVFLARTETFTVEVLYPKVLLRESAFPFSATAASSI